MEPPASRITLGRPKEKEIQSSNGLKGKPVADLKVVEVTVLPVDEELNGRHVEHKVGQVSRQADIRDACIGTRPPALHNRFCQCWQRRVQRH